MSAPTPEQMRALADRLPMPEEWERPFLNGSLSLNEQIAAALRYSADLADDQDGLADQHIVSRISADRDRLRAVIKNAPHGNGCSWFNTAAGLSCTCWKADLS